MVFADPQWLPEYLSERYPVLKYIVLEQVRPPCRARQASAYRQAGFRLGKMRDELVRSQRCRHRLYSNSLIHRRVHPAAPEMGRARRHRVPLDRDFLTVEGTHQDFFTRYPV